MTIIVSLLINMELSNVLLLYVMIMCMLDLLPSPMTRKLFVNPSAVRGTMMGTPGHCSRLTLWN